MTATYYHATTPEAADAIQRGGFRDAPGTYMLGMELTGVFVSDVPLDENEGTKGGVTIEIVCDEEPDSNHEIVEDGKPYREWCVPASWLNGHGSMRLLGEDEASELRRTWNEEQSP